MKAQQPILKVNTRYYRVKEWSQDGAKVELLEVNDWTDGFERSYTYDQLGDLLSKRSAPDVRFYDELPEEVR